MSYSNPSPDAGPRVSSEQIRDVSSLRRAKDQRMVAGVAEGLGRHFDVDPLLIRVVLAALTLFGGAGLALYVIAWITIPEEGQQDSALSKLVHRDPVRVMTAGLVVAAVIGVATMVGAIGFSAPNPVPIIVISGLAIGAFAIFSRRRPDQPPAGSAGPSSFATSTADATAEAPGASSTSTPAATGTTTEPPPGSTRDWWQYPDPSGPGGQPPLPPPDEQVPPPPPPRAPQPRSHLFGLTMGVIAIALGVLWILNETVYDTMPAAAYPATVLGITALALIVSAWVGRSRLLILVGIVAALMTAALTAVGDGPYGVQVARPASAGAVASTYTHGVGQMVLHLEDVVDPAALDGRTIKLDQHIGQLQVIIPSTLPVVVNAHVDHGEISGPARAAVTMLGEGGEQITMTSITSATSGSPVLTIDVDLDFGQILITQYDCPISGHLVVSRGLPTTSRIGGFHAAPACN